MFCWTFSLARFHMNEEGCRVCEGMDGEELSIPCFATRWWLQTGFARLHETPEWAEYHWTNVARMKLSSPLLDSGCGVCKLFWFYGMSFAPGSLSLQLMKLCGQPQTRQLRECTSSARFATRAVPTTSGTYSALFLRRRPISRPSSSGRDWLKTHWWRLTSILAILSCCSFQKTLHVNPQTRGHAPRPFWPVFLIHEATNGWKSLWHWPVACLAHFLSALFHSSQDTTLSRSQEQLPVQRRLLATTWNTFDNK